MKPVTVIYCDTGVEVPLAATLARLALSDLELEAARHGLPIRIRVLSPPVHESYWVKPAYGS